MTVRLNIVSHRRRRPGRRPGLLWGRDARFGPVSPRARRAMAANGLKNHQGFMQFAGVFTHALCAVMTGATSTGCAAPPRSRSTARAAAAPRWACRPSTHPAVAAAKRRLPHGTDRQVAPGLPACPFRPLRSGYESSSAPCRAAWTTSPTATRAAARPVVRGRGTRPTSVT